MKVIDIMNEEELKTYYNLKKKIELSVHPKEVRIHGVEVEHVIQKAKNRYMREQKEQQTVRLLSEYDRYLQKHIQRILLEGIPKEELLDELEKRKKPMKDWLKFVQEKPKK